MIMHISTFIWTKNININFVNEGAIQPCWEEIPSRDASSARDVKT